MTKTSKAAAWAAAGLLMAWGISPPEVLALSYLEVDSRGPGLAWGKGVGDINGDGRDDLLVGGYSARNPGLFWYQNPGWRKRTISRTARIGTDLQVADINRDGRRDVVAISVARGRPSLVWFENRASGWRPRTIATGRRLHDIEVRDLDGDGRLDVVGRNQGGSGNALYIWRQVAASRWAAGRLALGADGEGLLVADLDRDRKPDIIVNKYWLKNRSRPGRLAFSRLTYNAAAPRNAYVAVGDMNGDGRRDIVTSPAEKARQYYRLAWFEAPADALGRWTEHVIENNVESVVHFVAAADFNRDGRPDVATAMMQQGRNPKIKLYYNRGGGRFGAPAIVANTSSHNMKLIDINNDGRLSLFGADWRRSPTTPVELWRQ